MRHVLLRGSRWLVRNNLVLGERVVLRLEDPATGNTIEALCPPDEFEPLPEPPPTLDLRSLTPLSHWRTLHEALRLQTPPGGQYSAFVAGRISPEPYQFAPLARLLGGPRRGLLIADDVGLGKTIEAGICLLELIARSAGRRILIVVPPGLIPQWLDEMWEKFGLEFQPIENSAALDRAQTAVSEGLQPWAYFDRVITSVEYLKRRDVHAAALAHPWDVIVVDEAHYFAESGTPANPYSTARTRLGPKLREAARTLLLLTATPHNGYRHSFRSLLELVEPAEATLHGKVEDIRRRIGRTMIRRLKSQIVRSINGGTVPAFPVRLPVGRIEVNDLSSEERDIFRLVTDYCAKTIKSAEGSEEADLVSFAMQIVKKRMLSSRAALQRTVKNRLDALGAKKTEEPPKRAEVRELQSELPLAESQAERAALRVLRSAISRDAKRRAAEKKQLRTIEKLLEQVSGRPDPKIAALIADLERDALTIPGEKAIVFTEYRDTLAALRDAFAAHPQLREGFVELTGGLTARQRRSRIARFNEASCRVLLATDAASEGLNLQEHCCRLYHFELPWNPNRLEQRNGRIDRHGQTRPPILRYLFYPDSPEDRVLDRLVQRISAMHDDRVSTPDILGILEGSRIEDVLGGIESLEDGEKKGNTLMRDFGERQQEFSYQIAPLLFAEVHEESPPPYGHAVSADPLLADDLAFERLMREVLHSDLRPGKVLSTWRIEVPCQLQGGGVAPRYECATFRRSVAVQFPADQVEFIHRLHPLSQAIGEHALRELTLEPARNQFAGRVAVRRHPAAKEPLAVFTFLETQSHPKGTIFGIAVTPGGQVLGREITGALLEDNGETPAGEVSWTDCERVFANDFAALQATATEAARSHLRDELEQQRARRTKLAEVVRDEAERYRVDRLAEIDEQEKIERAGPHEQTELFREAATNWKARRAAVETHYRRRVEEIDRFAILSEPAEPQPLGVLLVFPMV
ncbi:MAG: DEAD/DEAH box helicase family protein [Deltaproteobacteria bacterium]|nr:DEAD/DEAH box helicase family protein [Deltaproteobacteria bacterium]